MQTPVEESLRLDATSKNALPSTTNKKSRLSVLHPKREPRYVSVLVSLVCFCIALRATFDMFFCLLLLVCTQESTAGLVPFTITQKMVCVDFKPVLAVRNTLRATWVFRTPPRNTKSLPERCAPLAL